MFAIFKHSSLKIIWRQKYFGSYDAVAETRVEERLKEHLRSKVKSKVRVAIIGGGISGAATSHFLKEYLGEKVHVTLFEKGDKLGGRTGQVNLRGEKGAHKNHIRNSPHPTNFNFELQSRLGPACSTVPISI